MTVVEENESITFPENDVCAPVFGNWQAMSLPRSTQTASVIAHPGMKLIL